MPLNSRYAHISGLIDVPPTIVVVGMTYNKYIVWVLIVGKYYFKYNYIDICGTNSIVLLLLLLKHSCTELHCNTQCPVIGTNRNHSDWALNWRLLVASLPRIIYLHCFALNLVVDVVFLNFLFHFFCPSLFGPFVLIPWHKLHQEKRCGRGGDTRHDN